MTWIASISWDIFFYFLCLIFFFLWQRLYKENYEKTKAKSMNYCETPKYQLDTLLKNFSEVRKATVTSWVWGLSSCLINNCLFEFENICFLFQAKYKDSYVQNVLGHYIGSFEDPKFQMMWMPVKYWVYTVFVIWLQRTATI